MPHRSSKDYSAIEEGAKLIARLRWYLASGNTQRRAAKRIGVSQATLYRWLLDQMSPDSASRVKIRKFLNSAEG
jgi:transcriptional regulator with XRE-family HTH domain